MLQRFLVLMLLISSTSVFAVDRAQFFKDIQKSTIPDVLKRLSGKDVTLMLSTGNSISGRLPLEEINYSSAFTKMVHLQKIVGQDYSDAVIMMNSIVGVIMRNPESP